MDTRIQVPIDPIASGAGYLFFYLVLFVPFFFVPLKLGIALIALLGIVVHAARNELALFLHPVMGLWLLYFAGLGCLFLVAGLPAAEADAVFFLFPLYVMFPLIYGLFVAGVRTRAVLRNLEAVMIVAGISIAIYALLLFISLTGILPIAWLPMLGELANATLVGGVARMSLGAISTLAFLVPFLVAKLLFRDRRNDSKRGLTLLTVLLLLPVVLLSGRRAVQVITVLTPLMCLILALFFPARSARRIRLALTRRLAGLGAAGLAGAVLISMVLGVSISGSANRLADEFATSTVAANIENPRTVQARILATEWGARPLLGAGLGTAIPNAIVRDLDKPWRFEVSYLAHGFRTGLIGVLAYGLGFLWLVAALLRIVVRGNDWAQLAAPYLVGFVSVAIAYATNPYFDSFDALWALFLPCVVVNLWLREQEALRPR